jgi:DNA-nicking Smr family endonuclease
MTGNDKPRRRRLSDDEHALWRGVTHSIAPLKRRPPHLLLAEVLDAGTAGRKAKPSASKRVHPMPSHATPAPKSPPRAKSALPVRSPPLIPLDRRLKQRLARGTEEIAGRIDLHGRTQIEAHAALLRFLARAQADGAKTVLVITGKGSGANGFAGERGVLKKHVPQWLALPEFRVYVAGVEEAHGTHGGQGALYVRVRRR